MVSTAFWAGLGNARTLRDVPLYWQRLFDESHGTASVFLRPVGDAVVRYPCFAPCGMKCRMHVQSRDGVHTAYCPETPQNAPDFSLRPEQAVIQVFDVIRLCREITSALHIEATSQMDQILENAWHLGSVQLPHGNTAPVFFVMSLTFATVSQAVQNILLRTQGTPVMLLPTMKMLNEESRRLIENQDGYVFSLSDIAPGIPGNSTDVRPLSSLLAPTTTPVEPAYRFEKVGEIWNVRWDGGETKQFKDTLGFSYYLILLENKYVSYSAHDLRVLLDRVPDTPKPGMAIEVADEEALKAYRKEMDDLQYRLSEAEANEDANASNLKAKIAEMEEHILKTQNIHRRVREEADELERARKSVTTAMGEVRKRLQSNGMGDLAAYLDRFIPTGTFMKYHPMQRIEWNT